MDWTDAGRYIKPSPPETGGTLFAPSPFGYIIARNVHRVQAEISQTMPWAAGSHGNAQMYHRPMPIEINLDFLVPFGDYKFISKMPKMVENMTILELLEEVDKRLKESKL